MVVHVGQVVRRIEVERLDVEPADGGQQRIGGDHAVALGADQACFRRRAAGETGSPTGGKAGFPRFPGRERSPSFTYTEYGNGAQLDNDVLVLSKMGRIAVRWSRPLQGTPKTVTISKEADGWYVSCSCADVPPTPCR